MEQNNENIYCVFTDFTRKEPKREPYHREEIIGDYDDFDDVEELIRFIKTGSLNFTIKK